MRVNMGAATIAAVSMGLSIDSSIHYLMHYQNRLRSGDRPLKSLRSAQENVGFAVVLATVALIAGFLALAVSEFVRRSYSERSPASRCSADSLAT